MLPRRARPAPPQRRMYVAFVLGGKDRVLPASAVAAVGELGPVVALPTADPRRLGLTLHKGQVVALFAPQGLPAGDLPGAASHLVVLREGDGTLGFPVEKLIGLKVTHGEQSLEGFSLLQGLSGQPPLPEEVPAPAAEPRGSVA